MGKRLLISLLAGVVAAIGVALFYFSQDWNVTAPPISDKELAAGYADGVEKVDQSIPASLKPLDLSHPVRLAIGGLGLPDDSQNQQLGDLVTVQLTGAPGFNLVERRSLLAILEELNLTWSGFVRARDAVRAGKLLKVDWFLLGTRAWINDTNCLVVRVVDASTGIMRDAGVLSADKPPGQLADDLAAFMRQSRNSAVNPQPHVYLAIGGFEDLSLNDRRADFPTQLRGYLTAAYHGSRVTVLEREYVETLLQEVRLDLAGLTDDDGTTPSATMQSAYWLVSGQYQSYETTNLQVELNLDIRRIFGKSWHQTLRDIPGDPIDRKIKKAVDTVMNQNSGTITLSRANEARMQLQIGKDLCGLSNSKMGIDYDLVVISNDGWLGNWTQDPQLATRQQRNVEEAVRAFETVLLLEPTNRQAKICLAACYRTAMDLHPDRALDYYREIIDEPVQDIRSNLARQALGQTLDGFSSQQQLRWLQSAAANATNAAAIAFYTKEAEAVAKEITIDSGNTSESGQLAQQRLFDEIHSFKTYIQKYSGFYWNNLGLNDYVKASHWDKTTAAQKLEQMLPMLQKREPELAPYLLATVLTFQVNSNTPLVEEFQQTLDDCVKHPEHVLRPVDFLNEIQWPVYDWCFEKTNYLLAVNLMEKERQAYTNGLAIHFDDMDEIKLGYAYLAVERWRDALDVFASFTNRAVQASSGGPWGRAFQPIQTDKLAAYCRGKLGLDTAQDPRLFNIGKPVLCLCSPSTFAVDNDVLWVGISGHLLRLDFNLRTNFDVTLPTDETIPVTALCVTPSEIWIGTGGAGLLEFDKTSHQFHRFKQADGLMMDNLSCLELSGDSLWIGYASATAGGLGELKLPSRKLNSFMPSLSAKSSDYSTESPPHEGIRKIVAGPNGNLWMLSADVVREYQIASGVWGTVPKRAGNWGTCFSANSRHLVEGGSTSKLAIQDLQNRQWQSLDDPVALPNPPTTMTLDGNDLWVGGNGSIALVDLKDCKVRKYCHIRCNNVDHIEIAGGYLWAQFDRHLYRIPLDTLFAKNEH